MKIIAVPSDVPWVKKHECSTCETVVELSLSDLTLHDDQREGEWLTYECPTCKAHVSVDVRAITKAQRINVKRA